MQALKSTEYVWAPLVALILVDPSQNLADIISTWVDFMPTPAEFMPNFAELWPGLIGRNRRFQPRFGSPEPTVGPAGPVW